MAVARGRPGSRRAALLAALLAAMLGAQLTPAHGAVDAGLTGAVALPADLAVDGAAGVAGTPGEAADSGAPGTEQDLYVQAMRAIADGRRGDASAALARMIVKGPRHASEWLDLAMVECAIGHAEEAEQLFRTIEQRFDPPEGIREIIHHQRTQGCRRWKPLSQLALTIGRGYDRNVNQGASNPSHTLGGVGSATLELLPEFLPQSDQYTSASAGYTRELSERGTLAFAQFLARRNDRLHQYDTTSLFGGLDQPWQWGRWKLRGTLFGGLLTLGGRLYQEQAQLQLKAYPPLALPDGFELYGMAGSARVNYKTLTNFDATTQELRAVLAYRNPGTQWQLSAGMQNDHAIGARPGGDRRGWSAGVSVYQRLGGKWQLEADLSGQHWQGERHFAPTLIERIRRQDTLVARTALIYLIDERQSVRLEGRRVRNRENISIFQYDNSLFQLNWQWSGF